MELLKFVPIKLTLFLVLGIVLGDLLDLHPFFSLLWVLTALVGLGALLSATNNLNSLYFGMLACVTVIGLGVFSVSLSKPKNHADHYLNQEFKEMHQWHIKIREVMKSNTFSDRYIATVNQLNDHHVSGKLLLTLSKDTTRILEVDDELLTYAQVLEVKPPLNPGQFNYKNYLKNLGVYHQMRLDKGQYEILEQPSQTIYGLMATARGHIVSKLQKAHFGERELNIIQAFLLGQRQDLSATTYASYKKAGAIHILAVSGLHIGIVLWFLQLLLRPLERLPKGKTLKLLVVVVLLWAYALLAGLSASIIRAVGMFTFVAYALYLNRPANTFNIMALSMFFVLLVFDPALLFQVGFQMSYAAVFAVVWIYPVLQKFWRPKIWVLRKGWQLLSVSIAAQLGVLPIALFHFHQFPGLFFISNLLVVPFVGALLGMGILVILLALFNRLPEFLASAYNLSIHTMNELIAWIAEQEAFLFEDISFDRIQLVLSYGIIIVLVRLAIRPSFGRSAVLLVWVIGLQLWGLYTGYKTRQKEVFLVGHQTKNTLLWYQQGHRLQVYCTDRENATKIVDAYRVVNGVPPGSYKQMAAMYRWGENSLFIVDSLGLYPPAGAKPKCVLLTQSPKIHLGRFIDSVKPGLIIADGSNYHSYIERWKRSCAQKKLPFHYTGEKGAYFFRWSD